MAITTMIALHLVGKLLVAEVYGLIFQEYGAPAHFGSIIHTALYEQFPG
jgi:hypothetical protein